MFSLHSFFVSLFLLFVHFSYTMDKGFFNHLGDIHCYNSTGKLRDVVKNDETGVLSARYTDKARDYLKGHRKTIFPERFDNKSVAELLIATQKNKPLFERKQTSGEIVEYKQVDIGKSSLIFTVVSNQVGNIVTAYPALRYISLQELAVHNDNHCLYIATSRDRKTNKVCSVKSSVEDVKKLSRSGEYLAHCNDGLGGVERYLVDISKNYTDYLFYGKEEKRGSILVETEWINKR